MLLPLAPRAGPKALAPTRCRPRGRPAWFRERSSSSEAADDTADASAALRRGGAGQTPPGSRPLATPQEKAAQHYANRAVSSASARLGAVLSRPSTQAAACSTIGAAAVTAAAAILTAPVPLSAWLFGLQPSLETVPDAAAVGFASSAVIATARMAGATLFTIAAVAAVLREAAVRRQLALPTFRRLLAAAMLVGILGVTVLAQAGSVRTPQLAACTGMLYGGMLLLTGRLYALSTGKGWPPLPDIRATAAGAAALLVPRSLVAAAYGAIALVLGAAAVASMATTPGVASPLWGVETTAPAVFWARVAGAGLTLQSVAAYSLKDAADRAMLTDAAAFRWLNLGLAAGLLAALAACCGGGSGGSVPAGRGVLLAMQVVACGFVVVRCFTVGGSDDELHPDV